MRLLHVTDASSELSCRYAEANAVIDAASMEELAYYLDESSTLFVEVGEAVERMCDVMGRGHGVDRRYALLRLE